MWRPRYVQQARSKPTNTSQVAVFSQSGRNPASDGVHAPRARRRSGHTRRWCQTGKSERQVSDPVNRRVVGQVDTPEGMLCSVRRDGVKQCIHASQVCTRAWVLAARQVLADVPPDRRELPSDNPNQVGIRDMPDHVVPHGAVLADGLTSGRTCTTRWWRVAAASAARRGGGGGQATRDDGTGAWPRVGTGARHRDDRGVLLLVHGACVGWRSVPGDVAGRRRGSAGGGQAIRRSAGAGVWPRAGAGARPRAGSPSCLPSWRKGLAQLGQSRRWQTHARTQLTQQRVQLGFLLGGQRWPGLGGFIGRRRGRRGLAR